MRLVQAHLLVWSKRQHWQVKALCNKTCEQHQLGPTYAWACQRYSGWQSQRFNNTASFALDVCIPGQGLWMHAAASDSSVEVMYAP